MPLALVLAFFVRPTFYPLFMVPRKFTSPLRCATLMAAAMMLVGPAPEAAAANIFWDVNSAAAGTGGTGNWDTTSAVWYNAGVTNTYAGGSAAAPYTFTSADTAYFTGTSGTVTLMSGTPFSVAGLIFNSGTFTLTSSSGPIIVLGSGGITLGGGVGITTVSANIGLALGAPQTWTINSTNGLVVNGIVLGSEALTIAGSGSGGVQLLNQANSFTGPLTITNGTVQVTKLALGGVASSLGAATNLATNLVMNTGATLKWLGDGVAGTNDVTDRLFTFATAGNTTIDASPVVATLPDLTKALQFTGIGTLGNPGALDITPRTLTLMGAGGTVANPNIFAPIIPDNGVSTFTGGDFFLNNTGVTKDGTGVWKLTGLNTFAGPVQVLNGTLIITSVGLSGKPSALGASDSGYAPNLVLGGPTTMGTLRFEGSGGTASVTDHLFTIAAGGGTIDASGTTGTSLQFLGYAPLSMSGTTGRTLTLTGSNTDRNILAFVIPDAVASSGLTSLVKNGPGSWVVQGTNTYAGGTTITAGKLRVESGYTPLGTGSVTLSGGMLDLGSQNIQTIYPPPADSYYIGTVTVGGGELAALSSGSIDVSKVIANNGTISAPLVGTGAFNKVSGTTIILSGYNTYTGGSTINQGVVQVGNSHAFGSGPILSYGTGVLTQGSNIITGIASTATMFVGMPISGTNIPLGSYVTQVLSGSSFTINLNITTPYPGSQTINYLSPANLILSGAGALSSASTTAYILPNSLTFQASPTLGDAVNTGALTFTGLVDLGGSVRTLTLNSAVTFSSIVSSVGGGITKAGPGVLTLAGANTYGAGTIVNAGGVRVGNNTALGSGALTLNDGVMLSSNSFSGFGVGDYALSNAITIGGNVTLGNATDNGALTFNGAVQLGGSVTRILTVNSDVTLVGAVTGALSNLTKQGPGVLTLSNNNNGLTGILTVSAGTLRATTNAGALGGGSVALAAGTLQLANDSNLNFARNVTVSGTSAILADRLTSGGGNNYQFGTLNLGTSSSLSLSAGNFITMTGSLGVQFGVTTTAGAVVINTENSVGVAGVTNNTTLASLSRTSGSLTVGGAGNLTITGGDVGSTASFIKNGSGTLTLGSIASTYASSGLITINGGSVVVGAGTSFTGGTKPPLTFGGSGLFNYNTPATGSVATQSMGALTFSAGQDVVQSNFGTSATLAGLTFGSLAARAVGADGLFVVSGGTNGSTNKITLTGVTPGASGILIGSGAAGAGGQATTFFSLINPPNSGSGADFAVYDASSFVRAINWSTDTTLGVTVAASATTLTASRANRINTSSGSGGTVTLASTVSVSGLKFEGTTTLTANALVTTPSVLVALGSTATIGGTAGLTTGGSADLVVRTDSPTDTLTISSPITSTTTGGVNKVGAGTLILSGANAFTGDIYINAGTLAFSGTAYNNADPATGALGAGGVLRAIRINGGTFSMTSGTLNPVANRQQFFIGSSGGTINVGGSAVIKLDDPSQLSGAGLLTLTGSSTSTFTVSNANNTFTGNVTVSGGTLVVGNAAALGLAAQGQAVVLANNQTALDLQAVIPNAVWVGGSGFGGAGAIVSSASGGGISGPVYLNSAVNITLANPVTISGAVTQVGGVFGLTKDGNSILTLSGTNNYTGGLTITNGAVNLANRAAAGPGGTVITLNSSNVGTALQLSNNITVYNPLNTGSTNQLFGGINFGGVLENVSGNNTYAGAISMAIDTVIGSTSGTLTLTGGIQEISKESQLYFVGAGNIVLSGAKITPWTGDSLFYSIQKYGTGSLTITNPQDFSLNGGVNGGAFVIRQGTVYLTGDASLRSNIYLDQGSTLSVDYATGQNYLLGRLSSAYYGLDVNNNPFFSNGVSYNVTFRGGNLTLVGAPDKGLTQEYIGSATFNRGSSVITIISSGTNSTVLRFNNSITNNVVNSQQGGPSGASLLIRGTYLGASQGSSVLRWNGIVTWNGQGGGLDLRNKGIMSWVLIDSTETGMGTSFATADSGSTYVRALNQQVYDVYSQGAGQKFTHEYDDDNLVRQDYNAHLTAGSTINVLGTVSPNSLTVEPGTNLALAAGAQLSLQSGGVLIRTGGATTVFSGGVINQVSNLAPLYFWTLGNLDLVTPINGGNGLSNGNISLVKAGAGVLALKPPLANINGLTTQGTNTFSGQMVINDGTVKLFANNAIQENNYLALVSGALDLNGKVQQVLSLFSDSVVPNANGAIINSAGTAGTFILNQDNNSRAWSGQIQGTVNFVRSGQNTFTLNSLQPFTGNAVFNGGTTSLVSEAALTGVSTLEVSNATLLFDNGANSSNQTTKYLANRLNDTAGITLRAGTINFYGRQNVASSETIGAVSLAAGFNVINANNGGSGAVYSNDILMASLTRPAGSAATFIVQSNATLGGAGVTNARVKATSLEGGGGLTLNLLGPWAINGSDFLSYVVGSGFMALGQSGAPGYDLTSMPSGSNPTKNVRLTGTSSIPAGGTTINALSLAGTYQDLAFTTNTDVLNLVTGGFIGTNNNNNIGNAVGNGRLTAGGAAPGANSDLYLYNRANTMTLNTTVIDNGASSVRLILTAAGGYFNLTNTTASYTGGTVINGGTVNLFASTGAAVIPAATVPANGLVLNAATVWMGNASNTYSGQIAATNIVTLNGASNLYFQGNNSIAGLVFNNYGGTLNPGVRTFYPYSTTLAGGTGVLTLGAAGIVATSSNVGTVATVEGRIDFGASLGVINVDTINVAGVTDVSPLMPGLALQAIVGSAGGLSKTGNGLLQLSAQSSFTSGFTVAAGGLRNGVLNAGSRYSTLTVNAGARYDLNNFTTTWGALAGSGDIFNSYLNGTGTQVLPTLNVGFNNSSTSFSGRLERFNDAVIFNFAKVGTGTLTMTAGQDASGSFGMISVLGGRLAYSGDGQAFVANALAAPTFTVSNTGILWLDNTAKELDNRLGLAAAGTLAIQGGKLQINGNATADTNESVNLLKVISGGGRIELNAVSGHSLSLVIGNLSTPNNSGSLVIAGIDGQYAQAGAANLTITNNYPTYQGSQGSDSNGGSAMRVRADIIADASASGFGTGFLVKDSDTYLWRALAANELNLDLRQLGKTQNVGLIANQTFAADLLLNTLTMGPGTLTLSSSLDPTVFGGYGPGGRLLNLGLSNASSMLVKAGTTATITAGSITAEGTAYFHIVNGSTLNLNASFGVGGSAGIVKAGDGTLNINRAAYLAPLGLSGGFTALNSDIVSVIDTTGVSIGSLVTGAGIPANSFVAAILSGTQFQLTSSVGVYASGPAVITVYPVVAVNGGTLNLNAGVNNTLAVAALAGPAGLSSLYVNTSSALVDLLGSSQAVAVLGSTNILPGTGGTVTNSNLSSAAVLTSAGGGSFGGVLSGNLAFTRSGNSTTLLTNANTYTGETIVRGGTLQLRDVGSISSTAGLKVYYGAVNWDNYGMNPMANPTPTRIPANDPVTLQGGTFQLTGGGATDTVVVLNSLTAAGGGNVINMQPYVNEGGTIKLTVGNLVRNAANHATFNLNGWTTNNTGGSNTLGSQGLTNTSNLFFTQLGGVNFSAATVAANNGLIGGWAVADGNSFATYTDNFGAVSLGNGWGYATTFYGGNYSNDISAGTVLTGNYNDGSNRTMPGSVIQMNSLRMTPGAAQTITPVNGTSYQFGVGIVTNAYQQITFGAVNNSNTLQGTGSELFIFVNQYITTINPIVTGSAALVSFGGATLQLAPQFGDNNYSGGTFVNAGTLNLSSYPRVSLGSATINATSTSIAMGNTTGYTVGMMIVNGNFPVGTRITGISPNLSLTVDTPSTNTSTQTGQTINSFDGFYAIPAAGGLTISNATVNMSANVYKLIDPATNITINGGGNLTLPNYSLGNATISNAVSQSFASLTFVNEGGSSAPTFNLGNPSSIAGTATPLSVAVFTSASPITATNNSLSTVPTITTGNLGKTELRFSSANPTITVNSGLGQTGLVISTVIGQDPGMTGVLHKAGSGLLALSAQNNFTSNFALDAGGLMIGADWYYANGDAPTAGPVGSGTLIINGGYLMGDGVPRVLMNPVVVNVGFAFGGNVATNNLTLGGTMALGATAQTITVTSPAVTATISGNITSTMSAGTGTALTKAGNGILVLSGLNDFNGNKLAITGGIVRVTETTAIPTNSSLAVSAGAGFDLFNKDILVPQITGGGFVTNSGDFQANFTVGDTGNFTFAGIFIDNINSTGFVGSQLKVNKVGTGKMTLTNASLNGGGLYISGGIVEVGPGGLPSPTGVVDIASGTIFQVNRTDTPTIASVFSGTGTFLHLGTGTTTLTGDATFNIGAWVHVQAGAVQLGDGSASNTGSLGSATVTVDLNTFLAINHSGLFFFNNAVAGAGELRQIGPNVTTLTAPNSYTGTTRINAGTLIAGAVGALKTTTAIVLQTGTHLIAGADDSIGYRNAGGISTFAPAVTINGTADVDGVTYNSTIGALTLNGGVLKSGVSLDSQLGSFNLAGNITATANALISAMWMNTDGAIRTITVNPSTLLTISGSFADTDKAASGYIKAGTGNLLLTGANIQTGPITISAGTLTVGTGTTDGVIGSSTDSFSVTTWSPVLNNAALVINRAGTYTLGNLLSGTGTLTNSGAGTVILTGVNNYTGPTTNAAGTLQVGDVAGVTGTLGGNAGTFGAVTNNAALVINRTGTYTLGNAIGGLGTLTNSGAGIVIFTGNNTYTGVTTLAAGTARITSLAAAGGVGTLGAGSVPSSLLFTGGKLEYVGPGETSGRGLKVADGGVTLMANQSGSALIFGSSVALDFDNTTPVTSRPLTLLGTNTAANTFAPSAFETEVAGRAFTSLVKNSVGTWVVRGGSTFNANAAIEVDAGILGFGADALGGAAGSGDVTLMGGSTLRWESGNTSDISGRIHVPASAAVTLTFADTGATPTTFGSSMILGTGASLTTTGPGSAVFAAANNFNGGLTVASGKLSATHALALGSSAVAVTVQNTGTLYVNAATTNIINVQTGGTFGGSGSAGAVTINAGATVSPGNGIGSLNVASLKLTNTSIMTWQVYNANGTAGVGYDTINISGLLDTNGANVYSNKIRLNIVSVSNPNTDTPGNAGAFVNTQAMNFTFAVVQGGINWDLAQSQHNISQIFDIHVDNFHYTDGSVGNATTWSIAFDGNNTITLTCVPEPSTYGLGIGALGLALAAVRRRRKVK